MIFSVIFCCLNSAFENWSCALFQTLVFDFGSEVYVWYGKNVNITKRKPAVRLARQLFDDSYDYSQYDVSPIDVASCLGDRSK